MNNSGIKKKVRKSKKKTKSNKEKTFKVDNILSLSSLCLLNLDDDNLRGMKQYYSREFYSDLHTKFWKEVHAHPYPLDHDISLELF